MSLPSAIAAVLTLAQLAYVSPMVHNGLFFTWLFNNSDPSFYPLNKTSDEVKMVWKVTVQWSSLKNPCQGASSSDCTSAVAVPLFMYFKSSTGAFAFFQRGLAQFDCPFYSHALAEMNGYNEIRLIMQRKYLYEIRYTDCCWNQALVKYANSSVNMQSLISFPLNRLGMLNSPVQLRYVPKVFVLQGQTKTVYLPVFDPDNDVIKCRWASSYAEGGGIYNSRLGTLDKGNCRLTIDGGSQAQGRYAVVIMLEDYDSAALLTKFHSIALQLSIDIKGSLHDQAPVVNCSKINQAYLPMGPVVARALPPPMIPALRPRSNVDGCKHYHNLTSLDRSIDYNGWNSYRCDMLLYGWYRFTDKSGNSMLNSCPTGLSSCGTLLKGWLKSQVTPRTEDGVVNRTVCFSRPGHCDCAFTREIQMRNCGGFFAYFLDAVPTCNARYCGKSDLGAKVYCSANYMRIELDQSRYNLSDYTSLTLKSSSCRAVMSGTKLVVGTKLDACGTTKNVVGNSFVYENQLILKAKVTGIISRGVDIFITFSCVFATDANIASSGSELAKEVNATESGFGHFKLGLHMHVNSKFNQRQQAFPVFVQLTDRLYFEVSSSATADFVVLVDSCFSTPVQDASHAQKYMFIKERCPVDKSVAQFHSGKRSLQRLSVPASNILANKSRAYIHCLVFLCHFDSTDGRCQAGCQGNNLKRTTRSLSTRSPIVRPSTVSNYYMVEIGAIEKERSQSKGDEVKPQAVTVMTLLLTAAASLVCGT